MLLLATLSTCYFLNQTKDYFSPALCLGILSASYLTGCRIQHNTLLPLSNNLLVEEAQANPGVTKQMEKKSLSVILSCFMVDARKLSTFHQKRLETQSRWQTLQQYA